ncbi:NAD-dependent epimerase/dehydratase family protein [Kitasatospora sp. NPDC088134]|uniref:NAD-dependent epimerase/dehydratase family protein n=1 Tax=Kitasatospora sp. NPDC088134 TaxID=3364071 RepID=UPI00380F03C7
MHVSVTGATGYLGSALVPESLAVGHQVTGLARTEASALTALGADARHGNLDGLRAATTNGVVHLSFKHDLMADGGRVGRRGGRRQRGCTAHSTDAALSHPDPDRLRHWRLRSPRRRHQPLGPPSTPLMPPASTVWPSTKPQPVPGCTASTTRASRSASSPKAPAAASVSHRSRRPRPRTLGLLDGLDKGHYFTEGPTEGPAADTPSAPQAVSGCADG